MSIDPCLIAYDDDFDPTQYLISKEAWVSPVRFYETLDRYEISDGDGVTPVHTTLCEMLRPTGHLFFCQHSNHTTITSWLLSAVWPDWAAHFQGWDKLPYDKYPDLQIVREIDQWFEKNEDHWIAYWW